MTEYVGSGPAAELRATLDGLRAAVARESAELTAAEMDDARAEDARFDALSGEQLAEAEAYLGSLGFHRDHRGVWRRRRGKQSRMPAGASEAECPGVEQGRKPERR